MQSFKFFDKKNVEINNYGKLTIGRQAPNNHGFNARAIKQIYMKPASLTERGFVYLSLDGEVPNNPLSDPYTIEYMRSSKDEVDTLLNAIKEVNPKMEIIRVSRMEELNKDAVVQQLRNSQSNPQLNSQSNSQLTCPACQSVQVEFIGNQRKSFSVGKAVAGGLLTGGYGALAGFAGKKGNDRWHCKNCGNIFETKPR